MKLVTWRPPVRFSKALVVWLGFTVTSLQLWAAPVSPEKAMKAASGFITRGATLGERLGAPAKAESVRGSKGEVLYYAIRLEPSGFIIVAPDDVLEPVIAFSATARFDASPAGPLGAMLANDLPARIAQAQQKGAAKASETARASHKWQTYTEEGGPPPIQEMGLSGISDVRVAPFVQTTWDQSTAGNWYNGLACYNYYTPPYTSGANSNYVSGCVSTAMAQLMRYWQYPTTSIDSFTPFTIYVDGAATTRYLRGGDGGGGPYVWANMVLSPGPSSTVAQRSAIGALVADAGTTVGMQYTAGGSSSISLNAKQAFMNYFHYGNAVRGWNLNNDIGSYLPAMLNPNLDARCPVILGISGAGGHAVVADGYGYNYGTLYHHLNLGWSGVNTAWYNLPIIDTGLGTFSIVHSCVYNVFTNGTGEIISGRITDMGGLPLANATITATRAAGGSYTATTDSRGIYALAKVPANSSYTVSVTKPGYGSASRGVSTVSSADDSTTCGNVWGVDMSLTAGPTAIDHFQWRPVASPQGTNVAFMVTIDAKNSTNGPSAFDGAVNLTGSGTTSLSRMMLGNPSWTSYQDDYGWTDGYAFTPTNNVTVTHLRTYYGTKVSIWSQNGTRLASQTLSGVNGSWTEVPLSSPLTLSAGNTYWISTYYQSMTRCYYYDTNALGFADGTIQTSVSVAQGDNFPNQAWGPDSVAMVDFRYSVSGVGAVSITPTTSGTFVNGTWSGNLVVTQTVNNLVVTADDGSGHTGQSNPFNVSVPPPCLLGRTAKAYPNGQFEFALSGIAGLKYQILTSSTLTNWAPLQTIQLTSATNTFLDTNTGFSKRFYRALWVP